MTPPGTTRHFQAAFARGLLDRGAAQAAAETASVDAQGYAVYANNVRASLINALANTFSVTRRLVGYDFFASMAATFILEHPPDRGWLSCYGAEFANFVALYDPASSLGYLADLARLEWARVHAANAADDPGLDIRALAQLGAERLQRLRLNLHPATSVICSAFPIFDIWQAHWRSDQDDRMAVIDLDIGPQVTLVTRAGPTEVVVTLLHSGDAALLMAVANHDAFDDAFRAAADAEAGYELGSRLAGLVQLRTFARSFAT